MRRVGTSKVPSATNSHRLSGYHFVLNVLTITEQPKNSRRASAYAFTFASWIFARPPTSSIAAVERPRGDPRRLHQRWQSAANRRPPGDYQQPAGRIPDRRHLLLLGASA